MPRATTAVEIVTIGDELLLGFTIDTNAAHVARALAELGVSVTRRATVGDEADEIARAVGDALTRTGAVITTGGLGPTSDDRTKPSIASIFGREMVLDEEHLEWMRKRWRDRFQREMPDANRAQAMMPAGATKLANNHGSAPGIWLEDDRGWVAMLPGVPREMRGMLADTLLPILRDRAGGGRVVASRTLRTTGIAESLLADLIDAPPTLDLEAASLAYLPGVDGVDLRITVRDRDRDAATSVLDRVTSRIRERVGSHVYGEGDADLAAVVLDELRRRSMRLALAESCTGGLLGARLTAVAGSSDVVLGGIIAYDNAVKREQLGVGSDTLATHGAVSEPTAREMLNGAISRFRADAAAAITGVAGPGGGTPEKPVGTVFVAVAVGPETRVSKLRLWGDRDEVRKRSAQAALELMRRMLLG